MENDRRGQRRRRVWVWIARIGLGGILLVMVLLAFAWSVQRFATARDARRYPPPGQLVDIGECRLHLRSGGQGTPTVVLEAGLGGGCLAWSLVQPEVAKFTRVVAYDRAGLGWSQGSREERTSEVIARQLRALLDRAGFPGPYVLVGHSFGGFNVRVFADRYPEQVAGLVLVDASQEDLDARLPESIRRSDENLLELARIGRLLAPLGYARWFMGAPNPRIPVEWREADQALKLRTPHVLTTCDEFVSFARSSSQVRACKLRTDTPLAVLSAADFEFGPEIPMQDRETCAKVWTGLQADLAARSLNSFHLIVTNSTHEIPLDQPQVVVEAIRRVVEAVRKPAALSTTKP